MFSSPVLSGSIVMDGIGRLMGIWLSVRGFMSILIKQACLIQKKEVRSSFLLLMGEAGHTSTDTRHFCILPRQRCCIGGGWSRRGRCAGGTFHAQKA